MDLCVSNLPSSSSRPLYPSLPCLPASSLSFSCTHQSVLPSLVHPRRPSLTCHLTHLSFHPHAHPLHACPRSRSPTATRTHAPNNPSSLILCAHVHCIKVMQLSRKEHTTSHAHLHRHHDATPSSKESTTSQSLHSRPSIPFRCTCRTLFECIILYTYFPPPVNIIHNYVRIKVLMYYLVLFTSMNPP